MKFSDLRKPLDKVPKQPIHTYWTTAKCKELARNYNIVSMKELRKMFAGYSEGAIRNKASELRKKGWYFAEKI